MKNHACKKIVCLLCAVLLLAAAVVPAYADDDSISVSSNPVTDGKTCSSCGLKSMVPTGATRTEKNTGVHDGVPEYRLRDNTALSLD